MPIPTVAAAIAGATWQERLRIEWSRLPVRYVPVALLTIPVVLHAAMLPAASVLEGGLHWQAWLTPQTDGLYHSPAARGWGDLTPSGLIARIAVNAIAGILLVSLLALLEEIGWRGWLLPRLIDRYGMRRAIVMTSAIWALWHVPYVLSGILQVDGVSVMPSGALQVLGTTAAGLVIGWLWVRTGSIWIVALAHGALNNWGQYAFKYMQDFAVADPALVLGAGDAALLVVGGLLVALGLPPTSGTALSPATH
jgi:membrane protease YdiL (CAAX protease family)